MARQEWGSNNPCFNCKVRLPREERRAPCCWNIRMEVSPDEFEQHFKDKPNVNPPNAPRISLATDNPSSIYVLIAGPCPNLNTSTGECLIEADKPYICRTVQPGEFKACAQAPEGRDREFLEK